MAISQMINRVVFFIESPLNERDYNRFGIEILQKNGFAVEVWDFTPLVNPQVLAQVTVPDPVSYSGYRQFSTREEMRAAIAKLNRECFVVCIIVYRYESLPIYRALSHATVQYCVLRLNALPVIDTGNFPVVEKVFRSSPEKLIKALLRRVPFRFIGIRPATVFLAGGERSICCGPNYPIHRTTKILWAHALDYDLYLNEKDKPIEVDTNMGVFLDQYLPFHSDTVHLGTLSSSRPQDYYPSLCKFFDHLESKYGARIVIAAHPRSRYDNYSDYFGGRPVWRGKTLELIRKARFTITHGSTAVNFAVLFNKPVLLITTTQIEEDRSHAPWINGMASWLNKTPINIDASFKLDWGKELTIDSKAYARYREAYIKKSGSPETHTWQIVADFLKTL